MNMKKFKDKKNRLRRRHRRQTSCRVRLDPWEEKAKSFLLGVQLSLSFYLLYMNIFGTEISRFI